MTVLDQHADEIRDLYADELLSARLRGIEGVPAKTVALENTVAAINDRYGIAVPLAEARTLLRITNRAPFSMAPMLAGLPRTNEAPVLDARMAALLSELRDAVGIGKA